MKVATFLSFQGSLPPVELELLKSFQRSLLSIYPHADLTILTDYGTQPLLEAEGFETFALDVSVDTLLLDRLRGFRKLMETWPPGADCFLFDYDMLILKDLKILEKKVDIAYTIREQLTSQPVNGGVAYYKNNIEPLKILDDIIAEFESLPKSEQSWWGDQLALSNVFTRILGRIARGHHQVGPIKILFLNARNYNFTPFDMDITLSTQMNNLFIKDSIENWLDIDIEAIYLCHFKGPRKHLQLQFEWQYKNNKIYLDHITSQFNLHINNIKIAGEEYLEGLAILHPSINEVNDFAVLSYLNYEELYGTSKFFEKSIFIDHLKKNRDARFLTLLKELPPLRPMD